MTSTCISSAQDLATFIKHNPLCDAQGSLKRTVPRPSEEEEISEPPHTIPRHSTRNVNIIYADPRVTEDLLVVLKDATSEEQARVERIEVHEIYI